MLKALIVDDEPLAHDVLTHLCEREPDIKVVAQCLSAAEALKHLERLTIDVIFLDIRMPMFGGLDLLRGLDKRLSQKTKLPVHVTEDPLRAVVRGTGIALKNIHKFSFLIINVYMHRN